MSAARGSKGSVGCTSGPRRGVPEQARPAIGPGGVDQVAADLRPLLSGAEAEVRAGSAGSDPWNREAALAKREQQQKEAATVTHTLKQAADLFLSG